MKQDEKAGFVVMGLAILLALGLCVAAGWTFDYPISWAQFTLATCSAWKQDQSVWCGLATYGYNQTASVAIPLTYFLWVCAGLFFYGLCMYKAVISYGAQRAAIGRFIGWLKSAPPPPRRQD
jgi:hypothetical protein